MISLLFLRHVFPSFGERGAFLEQQVWTAFFLRFELNVGIGLQTLVIDGSQGAQGKDGGLSAAAREARKDFE